MLHYGTETRLTATMDITTTAPLTGLIGQVTRTPLMVFEDEMF